MIVYLIRNTANGKCYVGKTTRTLKARWRQHRTEARIGRLDSPLYQDMRQFQLHCFDVEVLGEATSQRRLNQMERKFIRIFHAVSNGYNTDCAAHGGRPKHRRLTVGKQHTEEHKRKIADSVRASWIERKAAKSC